MLLFFIVLTCHHSSFFFFFNDTATTEIYTLSLHDALPISLPVRPRAPRAKRRPARDPRRVGSTPARPAPVADRKSTRLNSSHLVISYAVFCLKKKKNNLLLVPRMSIFSLILYTLDLHSYIC